MYIIHNKIIHQKIIVYIKAVKSFEIVKKNFPDIANYMYK